MKQMDFNINSMFSTIRFRASNCSYDLSLGSCNYKQARAGAGPDPLDDRREGQGCAGVGTAIFCAVPLPLFFVPSRRADEHKLGTASVLNPTDLHLYQIRSDLHLYVHLGRMQIKEVTESTPINVSVQK